MDSSRARGAHRYPAKYADWKTRQIFNSYANCGQFLLIQLLNTYRFRFSSPSIANISFCSEHHSTSQPGSLFQLLHSYICFAHRRNANISEAMNQIMGLFYIKPFTLEMKANIVILTHQNPCELAPVAPLFT